MQYVRHGRTYVIRFEDGETFPDRFLDFLSTKQVAGGSFSGLGAMKWIRIAFFDVETRRYEEREFDEQMEVLALVGNVALYEGQPLVHAHITLGRRDYSLLGGHVRSGIVRPTLEVTLHVSAESIQSDSEALRRSVDPLYGLPALDLRNRF
jgi:predicted DNA-binding protein with PD1-like motif